MTVAADAPWSAQMWEVFTTFWPLGLVAFGGPQAHVAILRDHLVEQRDWLDEEAFTELFAIGQVRIEHFAGNEILFQIISFLFLLILAFIFFFHDRDYQDQQVRSWSSVLLLVEQDHLVD